MTIDKKKHKFMFYINIVYEIPISSQWYKKTLFDVFDRDVTTFYEVPLPPLFSVTQYHEKRWDQTTLPPPPPSMRDVIIELPKLLIGMFEV